MEPQNSQPEVVSKTPQTSSSNKNVLLILIIFLFSVLVSTAIFFYKSTKTNTVLNVVTTEATVWNTYKNAEYGFEFNYPDTFTIKNSSDYDVWPFKITVSDNNKKSFYLAINAPGHGICSPGEDNPTSSTVTIGAVTAQHVSCNNADNTEWYFFDHNDLKYEINFSNDTDKKIYTTISTLKFTNAVVSNPTESSQPTTVVQKNKYDDFATCLKDRGAKFYGAFWCPHCQSQKAIFGKSAGLLPYIECSTPNGLAQSQICIDNKVTVYPTWEFSDGSRLNGELDLITLGIKTSCELPE
jgi:thiol-disulfide isomerase/thioredoxin